MSSNEIDSGAEEFGETLIQEAMAGNLVTVSHLINLGVDVNFANFNGVTPLMAAAQWRQHHILKFLLTRGADTRPREKSCSRTALMYACLSGSPQCVELLLQAAAEVNVEDDYRMTPLILAAITGQIEMVRSLVDAGANIGAHDENGFAAIDWARKWGRMTVSSYLLSVDGTIAQRRGRVTAHQNVSSKKRSMEAEANE